LDTRYRITVQDTKTGEYGYVYAYAWRIPHSHDSGLADYVTTAAPGSGDACNQPDDPACGWLRSTNEGSIGNLPRFNMFFAGNWSMEALCIKPYATDASCTVGDSSTNFIDLSKRRTTKPSEDEHGWDADCRNTWPIKDGLIRLIRRIQGAKSGRYTTKTEIFYGTWFEETVNLRVHPIGSVTDWLDHRVIDPQNPAGEVPSLIFTKNSWELNTKAMDTMDLVNQSSPQTNYGDWIQVDTSRGTYLRFSDEERSIQNSSTSFVYYDDFDPTSKDNQPGLKFGQSGFMNSGTGVGGCFDETEDLVCFSPPENPEDPSLNFAQFVKTLIPLAVDTQTGSPLMYRPEEAKQYEKYRLEKPLTAGVQEQTYTQPDPPHPGPCAPTLGGEGSSEAWHIGLNVSGCPGYVGFMLYRGLAPGSYDLLADLKGKTTFNDMKIVPGVTYRYKARAYDADGNLGDWSNEVAIGVTDTVPPPSVTGVIATAGANIVRLEWTDPGSKDIHGVQVRKGTVSGGPYYDAGEPNFCGEPQAAILGVDAGTTYYFVVVTSDAAGNETESLEVSATPY